MLLGYYTEDAYNLLLDSVEKNESKYSSAAGWTAGFFSGMQDYYKLSRTVEVSNSTLYSTPGGPEDKTDEQKAEEDLVNVRYIYDGFKITPLQASNKFMWTYLCHEVPMYYQYIQNRFVLRSLNTIQTRFFVTTPGSLRNDNALSRLWWYGHLTYDSSSPDPYKYTRILLMNQTIATDVIDTYNGRNPTRIRGVLLGIQDYREKYGDSGITDLFRECKKYLNHYAAVTTMEMLDQEDIRDITFHYMDDLKKAGFKRTRPKAK